MSFKRIPFIPMSPSSLPHRRGHDVVRLPVRQIITWLSVIREAEYAYWNEPMTDARRIELWKILAEGCQKHPAYRAKRQVKKNCQPCSVIWKARLELEAT